jgi:hypothetical protein
MDRNEPDDQSRALETLRERLNRRSALDALAVPPPSALRSIAMARRRRRRLGLAIGIPSVVVAIAVGSVVVAGALPAGPNHARPGDKPAHGGIVPWANHPYTGQAGGTPKSSPSRSATTDACSAQDLELRSSPEELQAREIGVLLTATNTSGKRCELTGQGQVRIMEGARVLVTGGPETSDSYAAQPALLPSQTAEVSFSWLSWCGRAVSQFRLEIRLEQKWVSIETPTSKPDPPPCRRGGSSLTADRWTVLNSSGQPEVQPQAAIRATITPTRLSLAHRFVRFIVTLRNPTRGPIALDPPCAYYALVIDTNGQQNLVDRYYLNCEAMPKALSGHGRLRLRIQEPSSAIRAALSRSEKHGNLSWLIPAWAVTSEPAVVGRR